MPEGSARNGPTFEWLQYVGLPFSDGPALRFAARNAGDHVKAVLRGGGPRALEPAAIARAVRAARAATWTVTSIDEDTAR
jgi:hypothetical protein